MSKNIENNVVQMSFDNKDFEKNISTSTKSVENLNKALEFKDAEKGFEDLEKYANSVNFDGLNRAISNINSVFTVTGALTKKIIDDIAGYFEQKIVGAISKVRSTISYIMDPNLGVSKYEQYTNAVKIMTANLADSDRELIKLVREKTNADFSELEHVESYIEALALYTDETSYSLTDMVDTMAKFAANNVGLQQSTAAMMGFANMAAVAGQNATVASQGMMQMSQAFSTGYVKYQDWMQAFSLKNIATKEAKEVFVKKALEIGTLDKDDIKEAQRVNGENWVNYFFTSDTLNQGWLRTSDVLVEGLKEYSKASEYILDNMENISETASVTDMLRWVEDYKKSGQSAEEFAASLGDSVDDVDALAKALVTLSSEEYELSLKAFNAAQNATNFHEAIDAVRDAVGTKMMYALRYFIGDLDQARKLWTNFSNSLWDVFAGPLDNALKGLRQFNEEVYRTEEVNGELVDITLYDDFWNNVGRLFTNLGSIVGAFMDKIRIASGAVTTMAEPLSIISTYTYRFMEKLTLGIGDLADKVEEFLDSKFFDTTLTTFSAILRIIGNIKNITKQFFGATFGTILKNLSGPLNAIADIIMHISWRIEGLTSRLNNSETFKRLLDALSRLTAKLMQLGTYLIGKFGDVFFKILDITGQLGEKLLEYLIPAIEWIIDLIDKEIIPLIDDIIEGNGSLGAVFEWVNKQLDNLIPNIKTFITDVTGMSWDDLSDKVQTWGDKFISNVGRIGKEGFDVLKQYFKDTFDSDVEGSIGDFIKVVNEADSVTEGAQGVVTWAGDALSRPIKLILDLVGVIINKDLSGLADDITSFIKRVSEALSNVTPSVFQGVEVVIGVLLKVLKEVGHIFVEIIKYMANVTDTTGFQVLDDVLNGFKVIFSAIIDVAGQLLITVADLIKYMTPAIKQGIIYIGDIIMGMADMIKGTLKSLSEIDSPQEALAKFWMLVKIILAITAIAVVVKIFYDLVYAFSAIGRAVNLVGKGIHEVADSFSGLLDSLAGDSFSGMIRLFTLLIFSIGYALSSLAKVGQAMTDPAVIKGVIIAFLGMALLIKIFISGATALMNTQTEAYDKLAKLQAKKAKAEKRLEKYTGSAPKSKVGKFKQSLYLKFLGNKDLETMDLDESSLEQEGDNLKNSIKGIASFLAGMAVAIVGIAAAVSILARASKATSSKDLITAVAATALIMVFAGVMLKLAQGNMNDVSKFSHDSNFKNFVNGNTKTKNKLSDSKTSGEIAKSGTTYRGVATALIGFAAAMLLLTVPLAILAHTSKNVGKGNFALAFGVVAGILAVIGAILVLTTKYSKDAKLGQAFSIVFIIGSIAKLMVALGAILLALGAGLQFVDPDSIKHIYIAAGILFAFFIATGVFAVKLVKASKDSKDQDWKELAREIGRKIAQMLTISATLVSVAMLIGAFGGVLYLLVKVLRENSLLHDSGIPVEVMVAMGMIFLIVGFVFLFIKQITKMKTDEGDAKSVAAKFAGLIGILYAMTGFIVILTGILVVLTLLLENVEFTSILGGLVAIAGLFGVVAGFMALMAVISKKLLGGNGDSSGADNFMKLALSLLLVVGAITLLGTALVGLAWAMDDMEWGTLGKSMAVFGAALLGLVAGIGMLALIGKIAAPGLYAVAAVLGTMALAIAVVGIAVMLLMAHGDKLKKWLDENVDDIRSMFYNMGKAAAGMVLGILESIQEDLPLILDSIAAILDMILDWLDENISKWVEKLVDIIVEAIEGLAKGIKENASRIATALYDLVDAIITVAGDFMEQLFPGIGEKADKLMNKWLGDPQKKLNKKLQAEEVKHQAELLEIRTRGAKQYAGILEGLANADRVIKEAQKNNRSYTTADIAKAYQDRSYFQAVVDQMSAETINSFLGKYGSLMDDAIYNQWESVGASKAGEAMANVVTDMVTSAEEALDENSPSKVMAKVGEYAVEGLVQGVEGTDTAQAGKSAATGIVDGAKAWLKDKLGGITQMFGGSDIMNSFGGAGLNLGDAIGSNMAVGIQDNLDFSNYGTDMSSSINGGLSNVYDMDSLMSQGGFNNFDYGGTITTQVNDDQISQLSDATKSSNADVVDQIKHLEDKLAEYTQAIKNIQMYLDTGALVGEMAIPLDKKLGELNYRKTNRGGI